MTLIEQTYRKLNDVGLVSTREQFSTQFVGKNSNWYSYQVHVNRDFSVLAAAQLLKEVSKLADAECITQDQRHILLQVSRRLTKYLREKNLVFL